MLADMTGFEPVDPFMRIGRLAIDWIKPTLPHVHMAEGKRFERLVPCGITGFRNQLLKPLGQPSILTFSLTINQPRKLLERTQLQLIN